MQDIYFDKVQLKNTRGLSNMEMEFPMDTFQVITGKIGTGKSTVFKSLAFALYGTDGGIPGESSSLSDMINNKAGKNLEILLNFRMVENDITDNYEIQLYGNHSKFQNKLFLFKNGVDISQKTKTDTYDYIENLLIPKSVFFNTVYFGQQIKNFFTSLTNSEQKAIFDSILSLSEYVDYYSKSDEAKNLIENELKAVSVDSDKISLSIQEKESFIVTLIKSKENALKEYEKRKTDLENQKSEIKQNIIDAELKRKNINFNESELIKLNKEYSIIESEIQKLDETIEEEKKKILENLQNNYNQIKDKKINEISVQKDNKKTEIDQKINNINIEINTIRNQIIEIFNKYKTTDIENEESQFKKEKQSELSFLFSEIQNINNEHKIDKYINEKNLKIESLNRKLNEIKEKSDPIVLDGQLLKKDIEKKEKEVLKDEDYLKQEVVICIKCKQPLNQQHIEQVKKDIEISKQWIISSNEKLINLRSEFEEFKKDVIEIKEMILKEEEKYQVLIDQTNSKKEEKLSFNERKRNLINKEIDQFTLDCQNKILILKNKCKEEVEKFEVLVTGLEDKKELVQKEFISFEKNHNEQFEKDMLFLKDEYNKRIEQETIKFTDKVQKEKDQKVEKLSRISIEVDSLNIKKDEIEKIKNEIYELTISLNSIEKNLNEPFKFDESESNNLNLLIQQLEKTQKEKQIQIKSLKEELDILIFWKEAFSDRGIKSMLIDSAIPHMNQCMRDELERLCAGVFTVTFDTLKLNKSGELKDKFSVNILHNIKGTNNHKGLSGGEKRLIDICCMRSLRSLSEKLYNKTFHNTLYDEVLDSLDSDSCQVFCQVVKSTTANQNYSMITHNNDYENMEPDKVYKF